MANKIIGVLPDVKLHTLIFFNGMTFKAIKFM